MNVTTSIPCALCRTHAAVGLQYTPRGNSVLVCDRCAAPGQAIRPRTTAGRTTIAAGPPITRTMHADAVRPPRGRR